MRKFLRYTLPVFILITAMLLSNASCGNTSLKPTKAITNSDDTGNKYSYQDYAGMGAEEITASMTLEDKAAQMVQGAVYMVSGSDMEKFDYGSILSTTGTSLKANEWLNKIIGYQQSALLSHAQIPFIYGQDSVHGVNYSSGTVIFPHNINIGAANDPDLTYKMGLAVADEIKLTGMLWNFAPCLAVSRDPRWGRTYESYSSDYTVVSDLGAKYIRGLTEAGVLACPKHFFGDGMVEYGTGEGDYLIDRGNATLTDVQIKQQLSAYQAAIAAGARSVMISFSSVNGVRMSENYHYITEVLKGEMGFTGFVVSDWEAIHQLTGSDTIKGQVVIAVNSGIDMLMEPEKYEECRKAIIDSVNEGKITKERLNDAVTRIIRVKLEMGLFDDPYMENIKTVQKNTGSQEYRDLAGKLQEESMVLVKNENAVLPLAKGTTLMIIGPAADSLAAQCGGWTISWMGAQDAQIIGGTSILSGFRKIAKEYNLKILTDPSQMSQADAVILCVGESPYAEWNGDTADLLLTGKLGLAGNREAIDAAASSGLPTIALIVAGRNVIIDKEIDQWDAVVQCYLPGSEGGGAANVLVGKSVFSGTLPMPWYSSVDSIDKGDAWLQAGFGLKY